MSEPGSEPLAKSKDIQYVNYQSEAQMPDIMQLIQKDLSEPYTVYTYRYFINNWGKLCFLVSFVKVIIKYSRDLETKI